MGTQLQYKQKLADYTSETILTSLKRNLYDPFTSQLVHKLPAQVLFLWRILQSNNATFIPLPETEQEGDAN